MTPTPIKTLQTTSSTACSFSGLKGIQFKFGDQDFTACDVDVLIDNIRLEKICQKHQPNREAGPHQPAVPTLDQMRI